MKPQQSRESCESGFTLVETLVALALLALISAYTVGSIRMMYRAKSVEAQLEERSGLEAVRRHVTQTLSDARRVFAVNEKQVAKLVFEGRRDAIAFVAPLNDRVERGGLYALEYTYGEDEQALMLTYQLFRPQDQSVAKKSNTLLTGVTGLAFSYYGKATDEEAPKWTSVWEARDRLPDQVLITVSMKDGGQSFVAANVSK